MQVLTDSGLNVKEFFDPFSTKIRFRVERDFPLHTVTEMGSCFGLSKAFDWRQLDFLLHLKKIQKLLKYAQNQRAKTIFVFFTKTYLLKQSIFFNILLKNRLVSSEENTEKKRNGIRERKESEFSLGL